MFDASLHIMFRQLYNTPFVELNKCLAELNLEEKKIKHVKIILFQCVLELCYETLSSLHFPTHPHELARSHV